jgi:hypothetical protein
MALRGIPSLPRPACAEASAGHFLSDSERKMVEQMGIKPTTSSLRTTRSIN